MQAGLGAQRQSGLSQLARSGEADDQYCRPRALVRPRASLGSSPMLALLAASIVAAGQTFTCPPTHVWDGDGPIWCAEGPHVRIPGIAAHKMDGTCLPNHPCPPASAIQTPTAHLQPLSR